MIYLFPVPYTRFHKYFSHSIAPFKAFGSALDTIKTAGFSGQCFDVCSYDGLYMGEDFHKCSLRCSPAYIQGTLHAQFGLYALQPYSQFRRKPCIGMIPDEQIKHDRLQ